MANEYYARVDYIYEGGDTRFSVPFPYIDKKHIMAVINEDLENPITDLEFLTDNQVQINTEIMTGATVSIRRITPLDDRFVDFTDGNILDEESQDLSALQVFDAVQEIKDNNDWLLSRMEEFTSLKALIDKSLEAIENASTIVQQAFDTNSETKQLVEDISATYEELREQVNKGVNIYAAHNLFEILMYDKVLEGLELQGLAKQGSLVSGKDYPDAYNTLLDEYIQGENTVYTSDEVTTYFKSFTGETTGQFYIPSDSELNIDTQVYSDEQCSQDLGTVEELTQISSDKYTGTITAEFYTLSDTPFVKGTAIYDNSILTSQLCTIDDVKTIEAVKYSSSITGDFYIGLNQSIRAGRKIYSDEGLFNQSGTITKVDNITTDKYHITGLEDTDTFYVPESSVLNIGTKVYKDSACSVELGTITNKGTISTNSVYCYSCYNTFSTQSPAVKITSPFYTKEPLKEGSYINTYKDSSCLTFMAEAISVNNANKMIGFRGQMGYGSVLGYYSLISQTTNSNSNYLILDNNETKLSYYKQASVSTSIICIDEGNNEFYEMKEAVSNDYIKLSNAEWQKYFKVDNITVGKIKLSNQEAPESFMYNGISAAEGIVFEYKKALNGHKIVSSKYKNKINEFIKTNGSTEFYVLNTDEVSFILPLIDNSKYIYFCIGNTVIIQKGSNGVTLEYLDDTLNNYLMRDDVIIQDLIQAVFNYNSKLNEINSSIESLETNHQQTLTDIETLLKEVLGDN